MSRQDTDVVETRRSKRRASDTRALMLEAGERLLFRQLAGPADGADGAPLAFIRITDVAREATDLVAGREPGPTSPVTTGSIYQLWPTQSAYQADLVRHLIAETTSPASPLMAGVLLDQIAAGASLSAIFDRLLELSFEVNATDAFYVRLGFLQHTATTSIAEALQTDADLYDLAQRPILDAILSYSRRTIRAPYTAEHVLLTIEAIIVGFLVRHRVDPDGLTRSLPAGSRALLAVAVESAFLGFTEPSASSASGASSAPAAAADEERA